MCGGLFCCWFCVSESSWCLIGFLSVSGLSLVPSISPLGWSISLTAPSFVPLLPHFRRCFALVAFPLVIGAIHNMWVALVAGGGAAGAGWRRGWGWRGVEDGVVGGVGL